MSSQRTELDVLELVDDRAAPASAPLGRERGGDRAERLPGGGADLPAGHVVGQRQQRGQPGRHAGRVPRVGSLDQPPGLRELSPARRPPRRRSAGRRPATGGSPGTGRCPQAGPRSSPARSSRTGSQSGSACCPGPQLDVPFARGGAHLEGASAPAPRAIAAAVSPTRSRPSVGRCTYPSVTGTSSSASVPDLMAAAAAIEARWPPPSARGVRLGAPGRAGSARPRRARRGGRAPRRRRRAWMPSMRAAGPSRQERAAGRSRLARSCSSRSSVRRTLRCAAIRCDTDAGVAVPGGQRVEVGRGSGRDRLCPAGRCGRRRPGPRPCPHVRDDLLQVGAVDRGVVEPVAGPVAVRVQAAAAAGDDRALAAGGGQPGDAVLPGPDGGVSGGGVERSAGRCRGRSRARRRRRP